MAGSSLPETTLFTAWDGTEWLSEREYQIEEAQHRGCVLPYPDDLEIPLVAGKPLAPDEVTVWEGDRYGWSRCHYWEYPSMVLGLSEYWDGCQLSYSVPRVLCATDDLALGDAIEMRLAMPGLLQKMSACQCLNDAHPYVFEKELS